MSPEAATLLKRILAINGVVGVRKPAGETSSRTVERVKAALLSGLAALGATAQQIRQAGRKVKVGHGGTLDPIATGVLVIGIGNGCKQMQAFLHAVTKVYRATARFGEEYDSYDRTGFRLSTRPYAHVTKEAVELALQSTFTGDIMQAPPIFSAIHVNGERAYDIARKRQKELIQEHQRQGRDQHQGQDRDRNQSDDQQVQAEPPTQAEIARGPAKKPKLAEAGGDKETGAAVLQLPARPVTVHSIELLEFTPPEFVLQMECSSGTYVRSIIHDLACHLGTAAAMFELERTAQGPVRLQDCIYVDAVSDLARLDAALLRPQPSADQ